MELEEAAKRPPKGFYIAIGLAAMILIVSGQVHHRLAQRVHTLSRVKVLPEIPFKYFPMSIGGWEGRELPISDTVLKVAANDDYVCRIYRHTEKQLNASLYIAYTCDPRRMIGHRPQVCYAGSGWILEGTRNDRFKTAQGRVIDILLHRFWKGGLAEQHIVVLNYYVVNGTVTSDHAFFSGLKWRRPQTHDGQADYVAQVQIGSENEAAAIALAGALTDQILFQLPSRENKGGLPQEVRQAAQ
ncbi:MAG: EpsI family protein [Planctomycetaceae bacterium]|nr:EpsI family protein [Planctomycetaceae bacterium]